MKFVFSDSLPNRFILVAQRGSDIDSDSDTEPTNPKIGYRVMMVELFGDNFEEVFAHRPFAHGWLDANTQTVHGRPVDVEWLRFDDSFLVSDDFADTIYRIYYAPDADADSDADADEEES